MGGEDSDRAAPYGDASAYRARMSAAVPAPTNAADETNAPAPRRGSDTVTDGLRIVVEPSFMPTQSSVTDGRFLFSYAVTIRNEGSARVRLASRRWRIVDAEGEERIAEGPGVVGQHPELGPGDSFEYSSFCPLATPWGTMEGALVFERDGKPLEAAVGRLYLVADAAAPSRPASRRAR
jgi:ApaG protein